MPLDKYGGSQSVRIHFDWIDPVSGKQRKRPRQQPLASNEWSLTSGIFVKTTHWHIGARLGPLFPQPPRQSGPGDVVHLNAPMGVNGLEIAIHCCKSMSDFRRQR
jgi:hypothetical protein